MGESDGAGFLGIATISDGGKSLSEMWAEGGLLTDCTDIGFTGDICKFVPAPLCFG